MKFEPAPIIDCFLMKYILTNEEIPSTLFTYTIPPSLKEMNETLTAYNKRDIEAMLEYYRKEGRNV